MKIFAHTTCLVHMVIYGEGGADRQRDIHDFKDEHFLGIGYHLEGSSLVKTSAPSLGC